MLVCMFHIENPETVGISTLPQSNTVPSGRREEENDAERPMHCVLIPWKGRWTKDAGDHDCGIRRVRNWVLEERVCVSMLFA